MNTKLKAALITAGILLGAGVVTIGIGVATILWPPFCYRKGARYNFHGGLRVWTVQMRGGILGHYRKWEEAWRRQIIWSDNKIPVDGIESLL